MSIAYPLAQGHYFGFSSPDIRSHTGDDSLVDAYHLEMWQRQYSLDCDRNAPITGRFDGPTQRACVQIQHRFGLDVTGNLDAPTWAALLGDTPQDEPAKATKPRRGKVADETG